MTPDEIPMIPALIIAALTTAYLIASSYRGGTR